MFDPIKTEVYHHEQTWEQVVSKYHQSHPWDRANPEFLQWLKDNYTIHEKFLVK